MPSIIQSTERLWLCITHDRSGSVYHVDKSSCKDQLNYCCCIFFFLLISRTRFVLFLYACNLKLGLYTKLSPSEKLQCNPRTPTLSTMIYTPELNV